MNSDEAIDAELERIVLLGGRVTCGRRALADSMGIHVSALACSIHRLADADRIRVVPGLPGTVTEYRAPPPPAGSASSVRVDVWVNGVKF